jgi:hypothetical protein
MLGRGRPLAAAKKTESLRRQAQKVKTHIVLSINGSQIEKRTK